MIDKTNPNPTPDPTKHTTYHLKVPESFQKAGFTEADYKKFFNQTIRIVSQEMDRVANDALQKAKERRYKIESGEE